MTTMSTTMLTTPPAFKSFRCTDRVPPSQPFPMTKANTLNNEVADEVGGGGDGLSNTALALPCVTSARKAPPLALTLIPCHHPPMHNYCRKNINYFLTVFYLFGTRTATKLIYLPLLQPLNSQRLFKEKSLNQIMVVQKVRMTMGML